jgi:DNA-binding response OmpR family regulator
MNQKSILIADDDKDLVNALSARCRQLGLRVFTAERGLSAFNAAVEHRPNVICLDVNMPAGNGMHICEVLADDPKLNSIPIIMLTGSNEPEIIRRCHKSCAYYVQKCPNVWDRLKPLLCDLLQLDTRGSRTAYEQDTVPIDDKTPGGEECSNLLDSVFAMLGHDAPAEKPAKAAADSGPDQGAWILHIEDDQDMSSALSMRLQPYGISVIPAFNGMEGYRCAFLNPASAIVLDMELPNGNGDYVMRRLKENPVTQDIPVIVLTGRRERSLERQMMNMGVAAYLHKPVNLDELLAVLQRFVKVRHDLPQSHLPAEEQEATLTGSPR